jgi:hypothetical protein
MSAAQPTTVIDDDRIRITKWAFNTIGANTGWHVHEYDYIVVPISNGTFAVTNPDGATHDLTQNAGSPYLGTAGTEHDVANATDAAVAFLEIELKR